MADKTYVGTVRLYFPAKGFGFLTCTELGLDDVFIHLNEQVEFFDNGTEPEGRTPAYHRHPEVRERIFFNLKMDKGQPRARPWGFADAWDKVWMRIECRRLGIPF